MERKELVIGGITGLQYDIEENEYLYMIKVAGKEYFKVEYNPLVEKWAITSKDPEFHEVWDYKASQKDEVVEKAIALLHEKINEKIWQWRIDLISSITVTIVLIILICNLIIGFPNDIVIGILCGFQSCLNFLQWFWFKKNINLLGAVMWLIPTISWLF